MNTQKKKPRPASSGPVSDPELDPVDPDIEEDGLPWETELDEWQAGERIEESTLQVVLYRLRGPGKGKERVWKWSDEIPDEHEIGLTFGSGTYMVYAVLSAPGGFRKVKHRRFTLAASYDAERARAQREQGLNPAGPAGVNLAGSPSSSFEMMLAMMERVIVPLLAARGAPAAGGDLSHWNQANEIVGRVVEASANSQLKIAREAGAMLAHNGAAGVAGEDEADEGDFKDYLKSVIKEYGPSLIEAAGLKLKAMAGIVKRDEVFTQLATNPELFTRVVKLLTKDPEVDAAQVEKVLTKLQGIGVAIPLPPGFTFRPKAPAHVNGSTSPA